MKSPKIETLAQFKTTVVIVVIKQRLMQVKLGCHFAAFRFLFLFFSLQEGGLLPFFLLKNY